MLRKGAPTDAETFQWIETPHGDLTLLSLVTNRYVRIDPGDGVISADSPGPHPSRTDGTCLHWKTGAGAPPAAHE